MLIEEDNSVEIGVKIRKKAFGLTKKSWAHVQEPTPKSPKEQDSLMSTRLNSPMWSKKMSSANPVKIEMFN